MSADEPARVSMQKPSHWYGTCTDWLPALSGLMREHREAMLGVKCYAVDGRVSLMACAVRPDGTHVADLHRLREAEKVIADAVERATREMREERDLERGFRKSNESARKQAEFRAFAAEQARGHAEQKLNAAEAEVRRLRGVVSDAHASLAVLRGHNDYCVCDDCEAHRQGIEERFDIRLPRGNGRPPTGDARDLQRFAQVVVDALHKLDPRYFSACACPDDAPRGSCSRCRVRYALEWARGERDHFPDLPAPAEATP